MLIENIIKAVERVTGREFDEIHPNFERMNSYGRENWQDWTFVVDKESKTLSFENSDMEWQLPLDENTYINKNDGDDGDGSILIEFHKRGEPRAFVRIKELPEGRSY